MKKILRFLTLSAIFSIIITQTPPPMQQSEIGGGWGVVPMSAKQAVCTTFTLDNTSADSLGEVTVTNGSANAYLNVTGTGQYQQQICFTATSVIIAGISVPYPNTAKITLPNGAMVQANWQSPSLIDVSTGTTQERPVQ